MPTEEQAKAYLTQLATSFRASAPHVADMAEQAVYFFEQRFWHELSNHLILLYRVPAVAETVAYELYSQVVLTVRADISPITYVKLLHAVVSSPQGNLEKSIELVDNACASLLHSSSEQGRQAAHCIHASLLLSTVTPEQYTQLMTVPGSAPHTARKILERCELFMNSLKMHEVEPLLVALYGMARGTDYAIRQQHDEYYNNAFDTVLYAEKSELPMTEADLREVAYRTAVAGLLSQRIFNFGRLLNYEPFISRLAGGGASHGWILELVQACNEGQVRVFEQVLQQHRSAVEAEPCLATPAAAAALAEKVRLMSLLHLVFYTPLDQRRFRYEVVQERCGAATREDAEGLLLNALAKGIMRGRLDGLDQQVHVTWVQPRILGISEVKALAQHVREWRERVLGVVAMVGDMSGVVAQ